MSVTIRTVFQPTVPVTVSDTEYAGLVKRGLVYAVDTGQPITIPTNGAILTVNIRTTMDPSTVITVSDTEFADLFRQHLVYSVESGGPILNPPFTAAQYADLNTQFTGLSSRYRTRDEAVRISAATLPTWTRKKQLAALGQSPARVLCIGDSTTAGVYSDSFTTATGTGNQGGPNAYPARLAAYLTARGVPAAVGMAIPGHGGGNSDSRWSGSAGQNYTGMPIGMGANAGLTMTTSGQQIILTPGVKADKFVVYYYADTGTGTMTGQATGGSSGTISTVGSGPSVGKATVTAGAPAASNTVTLSWASGTVFVLGIEFYDSTNPNVVRILPAGVGGSQAKDWNQTQGFGSLVMTQAIAPDLTIISLGINDDAAGRTAAQILADVTVVSNNAAKLSGDVMLMSAFPHPGASTLDQVNDAYYASSFPYVDLAWRYGRNMLASGLMTTDQTHPNALGYGDAAQVVARVLASA